MHRFVLVAAIAALSCFPAQAQSINGKWRTENTDPSVCTLISATQFVDPLAETDCRVTKTEKTGRNTWTLSAVCSFDADGAEDYRLTIYTRLLAPNRLRMRQGSDGPLLVYRRC